jgi:hypothetical protein
MRPSTLLSIAATLGFTSAAALPTEDSTLQARQPKSCGNVGAFAYLNQPYPPTGSVAHGRGCSLYYCDGNTGVLHLKVQCMNGLNKCQLTPQGQGVCAP